MPGRTASRAISIERWWWALAPLVALPIHLAGSYAERAALAAAVLAAIAGIFAPAYRRLAAAAGAGLLLAATISLAAWFARDGFEYHYVWLYSAPNLAWHLKVANIWAGDEGTLMLLALLSAFAATRLTRYAGWAAPSALLAAALFAAGASAWSPFLPTPAAELARLESQGMNAHLTRIWMVLHPPLIFGAYMLFLAPAGAALQMLFTGRGDWPRLARFYVRVAWLVLSAGLVAGMWWAYEDFTYGQVWHWDPVQTSVFVLWSFSTAQVHCLRRYKPDGAFSVTHPLLGLLAALAALGSMIVTRDATLASSHRYVGDTSQTLLLIVFGMLAALTLAAVVRALWARRRRRVSAREGHVLIWVAIALFVSFALVALGHIAEAYVSARLGMPRPASLKPFFETLTRFATPEEVGYFRAVFAQWDIDNFAMNRWLAPLGVAIGLVGGHNFLPLRRAPRWAVSVLVALAAIVVALYLRPFAVLYEGAGMTSGKTVAIFPWLDALLVTTAYLAVSAVLWVVLAARGGARDAAFRRYFLPVGIVHLGVMVALGAGLAATVLDTYAQKLVAYPEDFGAPQRFPGGYALTVTLDDDGAVRDGMRADAGTLSAFRSIADVGWALSRDGRVVEERSGHAIYRDARPPVRGGAGAVRLMCEMIDYRYARAVSASGQMIHPFIHRGLWRDVQVWFPALEYKLDDASTERQATKVPMVLKVFPMMIWLWIGLVTALLGALVAALLAPRIPPPPARP